MNVIVAVLTYAHQCLHSVADKVNKAICAVAAMQSSHMLLSSDFFLHLFSMH